MAERKENQEAGGGRRDSYSKEEWAQWNKHNSQEYSDKRAVEQPRALEDGKTPRGSSASGTDGLRGGVATIRR